MNVSTYLSTKNKRLYIVLPRGILPTSLPKQIQDAFGGFVHFKDLTLNPNEPLIGLDPNEAIAGIQKNGYFAGEVVVRFNEGVA